MKGHGSKFDQKKEGAIVALLTQRNIEEAAKSIGVAPNTLLRWMKEPEFDAEGRVIRITGVTQDVTDRKAGEEALRASLREKEVLLKEVHHRVKNNLQLISSLLALQTGKMKDRAAAEALAESQNRVRSMALVHENLYRSGDLSSVRIAGHLESLCAHLIRSYNIDPDRIQLDLRVAEVVKLDIQLDAKGKVEAYRAKLNISFKFEGT